MARRRDSALRNLFEHAAAPVRRKSRLQRSQLVQRHAERVNITARIGLLRLGDMWFKGERGVFGVPLGLLARQRYNPFYPYLQQRVLEAVEPLLEGGGR